MKLNMDMEKVQMSAKSKRVLTQKEFLFMFHNLERNNLSSSGSMDAPVNKIIDSQSLEAPEADRLRKKLLKHLETFGS